jgi:hypothetical protein
MQKMPLPLLPRRKFAALLFELTSCDDTIHDKLDVIFLGFLFFAFVVDFLLLC